MSKIFNDLLIAVDEGKAFFLALLDQIATFDTIVQNILLKQNILVINHSHHLISRGLSKKFEICIYEVQN